MHYSGFGGDLGRFYRYFMVDNGSGKVMEEKKYINELQEKNK